MNRRTFIKGASARTLSPLVWGTARSSLVELPSFPEWPGQISSRYPVNIYVRDRNPDFLSRFELKEFVWPVAPCAARSMMMANSHTRATLFHQRRKKRLARGFSKLERELPQIPVFAAARVMVPEDKNARNVLMFPEHEVRPFQIVGGRASFRLQPFERSCDG